jgi:outer membrane receptor protein involved in Fe transport
LPSTASNPEPFRRPDEAPDFAQLNLQVSRDFSSRASWYLGVENLTNVRQDRPIIGAGGVADADFQRYFDASLVYGPIFGRMVYSGFRWKVS